VDSRLGCRDIHKGVDVFLIVHSHSKSPHTLQGSGANLDVSIRIVSASNLIRIYSNVGFSAKRI
ncbi:uncharacterized protein METZ01_LOCUS161197, partial [marine metagenome]